MAEFGVTELGFNRKRLDQILQDLNDAVRTVLGENINLSPESPDGQINGIIAESDAQLWEALEAAYNAFAPSKATGASLSDLVEINGITRRPATATTAVLELTGVNGTSIPAGSRVSVTDGSVTLTTDTTVVITAGVATVGATNTVVGDVAILANSITNIDTPINGWQTVNNPAAGVTGQNEETDAELRVRREQSVARAAKSVIETILAEILQVNGVTNVTIYENQTDMLDPATGTPAHSFQPVVLGGDDLEVATEIFNEKPVGIASFGTTLVPVTDSQGFTHDIGITRPTAVPIYVIVNITIDPEVFPQDGDTKIEQAIVDYANGDLVQGRGFSVEDDVIHSEIYTPINTVPGHTVDSMFIGIAASPTTTDDIPIAFNEISSFLTANITVNVT